jgi:hypothetical protein
MVQRPLKQKAFAACLGDDCAEVIAPGRLFCHRCDAALLDETRELVAKLHRPGAKWTLKFQDALERARTEIAYARKTGHRLEHTAKFEW